MTETSIDETDLLLLWSLPTQRGSVPALPTLLGLLTVKGMLVTQGMCTTAVFAQIQDFIAKQANI
jgi:hypothetical protein